MKKFNDKVAPYLGVPSHDLVSESARHSSFFFTFQAEHPSITYVLPTSQR